MFPVQPKNPDMPRKPGTDSNASAEAESRSLSAGAITTTLLFQGSQEILISHNGEPYRLRITKNGKLIPTK